MTEHDLKTWPPHWEDVNNGRKTVEIRTNDRDYQVGDVLILREWQPQEWGVDPEQPVPMFGDFTGRVCRRVVTHVLPGGRFGLDSDVVALSIAAHADDDWPECERCGGSGYQPCAPGSPHPAPDTALRQRLLDAIRSVPADAPGNGTEAVADAVLAVVQAADLRCCLYPRRCSQCGGRWADEACGPTHALIAEELGLGDLRRERATAREWAGRLAEEIAPTEVLAEHGGDGDSTQRWQNALAYFRRPPKVWWEGDPAPDKPVTMLSADGGIKHWIPELPGWAMFVTQFGPLVEVALPNRRAALLWGGWERHPQYQAMIARARAERIRVEEPPGTPEEQRKQTEAKAREICLRLLPAVALDDLVSVVFAGNPQEDPAVARNIAMALETHLADLGYPTSPEGGDQR